MLGAQAPGRWTGPGSALEEAMGWCGKMGKLETVLGCNVLGDGAGLEITEGYEPTLEQRIIFLE